MKAGAGRGQARSNKYKKKYAMFARMGEAYGKELRNLNDLALACEVSLKRMQKWANENKDFAESLDIFNTILANKIQNLILDVCEGKLKNVNIAALIFAAKNQSEWNDTSNINFTEAKICKFEPYEK